LWLAEAKGKIPLWRKPNSLGEGFPVKRFELAVWVLFVFSMVGLVGCGEIKPSAPSLALKPVIPLMVHPSEAPTRVFSSEEEIPTTFSSFDGAKGSVRVTLEIEGNSKSSRPTPMSINDVLFKAVGEGRISLAIKRPWPEHPNGRVTIGCCSGTEESSAEFEPELWFDKPGAIVTFESVGSDSASLTGEGKEIVLGRYVARNVPQDIRLTLKAMFTREPVTPRTNAGMKPVP
jgi:hypothetical protein